MKINYLIIIQQILLILILNQISYSQDIINNHISGNFQIDTIHKAGYKNPLLKGEVELSKRIGDLSSAITVGHFFRYIKTDYESKHYISIKVTEKYYINALFIGAAYEYTKAKVQLDQTVNRLSVLGGYTINDFLEVFGEYQFHDKSLYNLSSVHFGVNAFYPISNKWFIQVKESPYLFFTNRDNLGRVGNNLAIGIAYSL